MAIWTKLAYAYTYDAQNLCAGVIFDCEQNGHTIVFKFEFFGFLVIRFETKHLRIEISRAGRELENIV